MVSPGNNIAVRAEITTISNSDVDRAVVTDATTGEEIKTARITGGHFKGSEIALSESLLNSGAGFSVGAMTPVTGSFGGNTSGTGSFLAGALPGLPVGSFGFDTSSPISVTSLSPTTGTGSVSIAATGSGSISADANSGSDEDQQEEVNPYIITWRGEMVETDSLDLELNETDEYEGLVQIEDYNGTRTTIKVKYKKTGVVQIGDTAYDTYGIYDDNSGEQIGSVLLEHTTPSIPSSGSGGGPSYSEGGSPLELYYDNAEASSAEYYRTARHDDIESQLNFVAQTMADAATGAWQPGALPPVLIPIPNGGAVPLGGGGEAT